MADHSTHTLQSLGYRLTPQRQLVWDTVRKSARHISAEEICADIQTTLPAFNIASVYRTLDLLEKVGLVRVSYLGDGHRVYEVDEGSKGHHHLVCDVCHTTVHFDAEPVVSLRTALERDYGYSFDDLGLVVFGRCPACQKAPPVEAVVHSHTEA